MTIEIMGVAIDCPNPRKLAEFWTAALDYEISLDFEEGEFVFLRPKDARPGADQYVSLQKVPEERAGKNRVHLDFQTSDRPGEVARLVALGATVLGEHDAPGLSWTVLTDPEGNEFCVASPTG